MSVCRHRSAALPFDVISTFSSADLDEVVDEASGMATAIEDTSVRHRGHGLEDRRVSELFLYYTRIFLYLSLAIISQTKALN